MLIPQPIRKLIGVFRGQVSPTFVFLSAALGFWFGLLPGWQGLHVVILLAALVLSIHAGTFILFAAFGKGLCFAAAPVLYHVGRWAQTGLGGLFESLGNLPIIGLTDFDRCAVAGATVLGPIIGILGGLALGRAVFIFRRTWQKLETGSEGFRAWQQKSWVRWLDWLLLGKRAKSAQDALAKKGGLVRPAGIAVAVLLLVASGVGLHLVGGNRLHGALTDQLTKANGADVSLGQFDLQPLAGRVAARRIEVTDPEQPAQNRIQIRGLTADVGLWGLLSGRLIIDEVELDGVAFDTPRDTPGSVHVTAAAVAPTPPAATFEPARFALRPADVGRLSEYYRQGADITKQIKELARWLPEREAAPPPPAPPQHYLEYLTARSPRAVTPLIVIRRAVLANVRVPVPELGRSTITCLNISDAPRAAGLPLEIAIASETQPNTLKIVCRYDEPAAGIELEGTLGRVNLAKLQERLNPDNPVRLEGGLATASIRGRLSQASTDVQLAVETQNLKARMAGGDLFGLDPQAVDEALKVLDSLKTTLRVVGPLDDLRLAFDSDGLRDEFKTALVQAGKQELVARLDAALGDKLPAGVPDAAQLVEDPVKSGQAAIENLLQGQQKDEDKKK